ncbi:MAG: sodium:solute symporter [Bacteroidota bacterium]
MTPLDWTIVIVYMFGMIGLSVYLGRSQEDQADYYVGGRKLPWWAIGISTMATQTSAISFISIPAFVALKEGGGLTWLQYELAVPLAMIVVMAVLIPFFRRLELVSVYRYLELRYGRRSRLFVSGVFLFSRGVATGVGVYASAIVLSVCLGLPVWATILVIGIVTIIYDTIGGMSAVVYSDVIQMVILVAGLLFCIAYALIDVGGWSEAWSLLPDARKQAIDWSAGVGDESTVPFWAFLFGGLFLYTSYYGTDQSQVQRELSADSTAGARKALVLNGFARFPLTVLYILMGVAVYAVYATSPDLQAAVPTDRPDFLVPQFILLELPTGVRAILFAALLAAAMSSLDSALNSLSASTMRDFLANRIGPDREVVWSKGTTVVWGLLITTLAFFVDSISDTVIEAINKVGSAFYGPILATFLMGVLTKRVDATGAISGLLTGVLVNVSLWLFVPGVHWMWWNVIGCAVTAGVALVASKGQLKQDALEYTIYGSGGMEDSSAWRGVYVSLIGYFVAMVSVLVLLG